MRQNEVSGAAWVTDRHVALLLRSLENVDLFSQFIDFSPGLLNGTLVLDWILRNPTVIVARCLVATPLLPLNLEAIHALFGQWKRLVNESRAARFALAVLGLAVLTEVAPFPVVASVLEVIVVAHVALRLCAYQRVVSKAHSMQTYIESI
jgi:hypothetical protein